MKYIGLAIAVVGAIIRIRAPNDLVLLAGILVTLSGLAVLGVQFDCFALPDAPAFLGGTPQLNSAALVSQAAGVLMSSRGAAALGVEPAAQAGIQGNMRKATDRRISVRHLFATSADEHTLNFHHSDRRCGLDSESCSAITD